LGVEDLLQAPQQFQGKHLKVSGCLIKHRTTHGAHLIVLAPNCSLRIGNNFSLVADQVLDVTGSDSLPEPGPTVLDATFERYGRSPNSINLNLAGISNVGELVVTSWRQ
jgi:hypothetical protein